MSEKPENSNAFPNPFYSNIHGMTLQDYFAGQAIGAIITVTSAGQHQPGGETWDASRTRAERMAFDAYTLADAMLQERGQ